LNNAWDIASTSISDSSDLIDVDTKLRHVTVQFLKEQKYEVQK